MTDQKRDTNQNPVVAHSEVEMFSQLPLSANVLSGLELTNYESPTPIQAAIIPPMMEYRDVLAQSQTGSGKTAAFALPILSRHRPAKSGKKAKSQKPQVLVLTPTRELAIQVSQSFSTYAACIQHFSVAAIYGGQSYTPQLKQLRSGVNVVVGTPGRVIDHIKRGTLDISRIETLVLDEADEMLNMGFLEDVEFVLQHAPAGRQVALFSATMPTPIRNISKKYLNDPARITIQQKTMTSDTIRQRAVFLHPGDRVDALIRFIEAEQSDGVMVFTRTRETTTRVAEQLAKSGLKAVALNGDMSQQNRERTIQRLKSGALDILVATDVAARGLDVARISHVFNFDAPENSEAYIHRIGRTGRAGRTGDAIIFLSRSQRGRLRMLEKATRDTIQVTDPPSANQINKARVQDFKSQVVNAIQNEDLDLFRSMVNEIAAETDESPESIAAAIAHVSQQGRPFLMVEEKKHRRKRDFERGSFRSSHGGRPKRRKRGAKQKPFRARIG